MFYIIGHKNPDTDAIVSALVMADYFQKEGKENIQPARAGEINKETQFVLESARIEPPALLKDGTGKCLFLVDHNAPSQAVDGIEKAEIKGILDHHKLSGIETPHPVYVRIEPIGSSSTIIFKLFQEKGFGLEKSKAWLLLGGILSDTLKLTSPTTTEEDRHIAKHLAEIADIDIEEMAQNMFKAKSDISGISLKNLISSDYKEYSHADTDFAIGVWETTLVDSLLNKKEELLGLLRNLKKERKMDLMFFGVVDILKKQTHLFIIGEKEMLVAQKAFGKKVEEGIMFLPDVVSRKKQILPAIINAL